MALFRDPVLLSFVDEDNREILTSQDSSLLPRVGENVRIAGTPYLVARVGYDYPADRIERVWIVLRPA